MKQLLTILLFLPFFISCSSDDDGVEKAKTTVKVKTNEPIIYENVTLGYFTKDNKCIKVAEIGRITNGPAIEIANDTLTRLYIFFDKVKTYMVDSTYTIKKGQLNECYITNKTKSIEVNKADNTKYPH